jgi:subtilisin family serine protease
MINTRPQIVERAHYSLSACWPFCFGSSHGKSNLGCEMNHQDKGGFAAIQRALATLGCYLANPTSKALPSAFDKKRLCRHCIWAAAWSLCLIVVTGWAAPATHPQQQYVEGEVLVTFKPSVNLESARGVLAAHSMELTKHFAYLSAQRGKHCGLARAKSRSTMALIAELSRHPAVETVEPNYLRWVSVRPPNDTLFPQLWGLQNSGQTVNGTAGTANADIKFLAAWAMARPSAVPVVVAVVDTGVNYTHPDLAANMWTNPGEIPNNGVDDDGNGYVDDYYGYDFADGTSDPSDSGFHGTHVAGTIAAAGNNLLGVIGVQYQSRIMALKVSKDGSSIVSSAEIEALQYATMMKGRGVNVVVINASYGGGGASSTEQAAIQAAGNAGIIFCAAAGNSSLNHDTTPVYPASYRLPNMIVIAATDQNDALASFSDYGANTVDLGSPGVNILSAEPTNMGAGFASLSSGSVSYSAGAMTYSGITPGLTATLYYCALGNPGDFPAAVSNNIALISRGTLTFSNKVFNATAAGAKAAVIYNNVSGSFLGTLGSKTNWIPTASISQADGLTLKALTPTSATVATQPYQFLDGTSMATPHTVGAVAFAAMNFPTETVSQRIQRVVTNVDVVPALQGVVRSGGRLNLLRIVDTDGNGLPDWWEQLYFGQLTGTDPNADPDNDGASNLAEWLAGTDPTDPNSYLKLVIPNGRPTNGYVVQWPSVAGRFYRLQRATNLATGFNTLVQTNVAATPPTNTLNDTTALPGNTRFYQLQLEQ